MKLPVTHRIAFYLLLFLLPIAARAQSYRDELEAGVTAYKDNHYEQAAEHFRKATEIDPSQMTARMYLATVYVSEYIPGVDSPDNLLMAKQAIEQYQIVLDAGSSREQRLNSAKGIAYLHLNMKRWEDAKQYYHMASDLDPNDPEPFYSIGVIDWTTTYQPRMNARARLGMQPEEYLDARVPAQRKICDDLNAENTSAIEDGITNLKRAIDLRPDYDDAMAYMNLMYRERADLECDTPSARAEDLRTADDWVDKTLAVKKAKAEKSKPGYAATEPNPQ